MELLLTSTMLLTCRINLQCLSTQILLEFGDSGQSSLAIRQWRILNFNEQAVVTVVPPIAYTKCLAGTISDTGQARISYGFDASTLHAYAPSGVKDIVCVIVMLGY